MTPLPTLLEDLNRNPDSTRTLFVHRLVLRRPPPPPPPPPPNAPTPPAPKPPPSKSSILRYSSVGGGVAMSGVSPPIPEGGRLAAQGRVRQGTYQPRGGLYFVPMAVQRGTEAVRQLFTPLLAARREGRQQARQ